MPGFRGLAGMALFCALAGVFRGAADEVVRRDWGPFFAEYTDVGGREIIQAAGPFYQHARLTNGVSATAFRPFYGLLNAPEERIVRREILFPLGHVTDFGQERKWRFLTAIGWDFDRFDPESSWKFWIFPFWYQGKSRSGHRYLALWPLGGTIRDFAWQDRITFVLWPLFSTNQMKELSTISILWPFYSHTRGGDIERRRWLPFYGTSREGDRKRHRFILWPFWTEAQFAYTRGSGRAFMFWPFYGRAENPTGVTRWFLPPFFRVSTDRRDRIEYGLWPIFQRRKSEAASKWYLFPLYGWSERGDVRRSFVLWPVYRASRIDRAAYTYYRRFVLPFVYWHTREPKEVEVQPGQEHPEVPDTYFELWPVFSWEARGGTRTFRMLEFWPGRDPEVVNRNLSPLWTPIRHTATGAGADTEVLWGLFRRNVRGTDYAHTSLFPFFEKTRDDAEASRRWQIGKGLLGVTRKDDKKQFRILWFIRIGSLEE